MKKTYLYTLLLSVLMLLTGCDEDAYQADTLQGGWTGTISTYYYDRWGLTGSDYRTTIYFDRYDAYGGEGYEVDYKLSSRYRDYYYSPIEWEVRNGVIRIYYPDDDYYVEISNYLLNASVFEGYMYDGTNRDIEFHLYYDGSFDWEPYWGYDGYPAFTRAAEPAGTAKAGTPQVRKGRSVSSGVFAKGQAKP